MELIATISIASSLNFRLFDPLRQVSVRVTADAVFGQAS
jgi:hypothetical protein